MKEAILLTAGLLLVAAAAEGQAKCDIDPEHWSIRDHGKYEAIVTYHNSSAGCSIERIIDLTSDNGIRVQIDVDVNTNHDGPERIMVFPFGPDYQVIPPEGVLKDGQSMEFLVTRIVS